MVDFATLSTGLEEAAQGSGSLPDQSGNDGKFLTTDGSAASWATVSSGGLPAGGSVGQPVVNTGDGTGDWGDVIQASSGNAISLLGGDNGGAAAVAGGDSDSASGGNVYIASGTGVTSCGNIVATAGQSATDAVAGGSAVLAAGAATVGNADGGLAGLTGGDAKGSGQGGSVNINSGASPDAGNGGDVHITLGLGDNLNGHLILTNIPGADPGIPGAVYQTAGALMISL